MVERIHLLNMQMRQTELLILQRIYLSSALA